MSNFSLEAMQAVLQSRFGKELDSIWQEIIDYRDNTLSQMSYSGKVSAIKKFFVNTTGKKFSEAVWKHVGLHISGIRLRSSGTGSFCTWMWFDSNEMEKSNGTSQIEAILNADYVKRTIGNKMTPDGTFTAEQLMNMANSYDSNTGGIGESVKIQLRKFVKATIEFDVELGFLLEDRLPPNAGVSNLTARELTAIMLHEIGHTLTLVEHAGDVYARTATFKYLTTAFANANAGNIDEIYNLTEKVAAKIEKPDPTNAKRLIDAATKLRNDIRSTKAPIETNSVKSACRGLMESCFAFLTDVLTIPMNLLIGNMQSRRFSSSEQKAKFGDIPINGRLATWQERKADEYAFSHGYGADQASALNKISKYLDRMGLSERQIRTLNTAEQLHKGLGLCAKLRILCMAPLLAGDYDYSLYPAGAKRFRELMNITVQQLKANSTDPDYVAKYMSDIEKILNVVDNSSSSEEYVAKIYRGYDIFMKYASLPSFIDWIVHGRVKRELEDLINDANSIGNNLLTYYGLKIQQLAK